MTDADRARLARSGLRPLSTERGLELFDRARAADDAVLVPLQLELPALRAQARAGMLPALFRSLVREPARRTREAAGTLRGRLAALPEPEWDTAVLELVRSETASVLGHGSPEAIDPERAFQELGFDSLAAVELRNRVRQAAGIKLPATAVFDHPTPAAVAEYMLGQVPRGDGATPARPALEGEFKRIERLLEQLAADDGGRAQVAARVRAFNARVQSLLASTNGDHDGDGDADLESASDEEVFAMIDKELGES